MKNKLIETLQNEENNLLKKIEEARQKDDFNKYKMLIHNLKDIVHLKDEQMQRYGIDNCKFCNTLQCGDVVEIDNCGVYILYKIDFEENKYTPYFYDLISFILKKSISTYNFTGITLYKAIETIMNDLDIQFDKESLNNIIKNIDSLLICNMDCIYKSKSAYEIVIDMFKQCEVNIILKTKRENNKNVLYFEEIK